MASLHFEAGLTRGEGGLAPAAIVGADKADYAFLSLKSTAFDLSDRGVAGRQVPAGLDAFVYTERGVYRSGETVHVTSLLRDARGIAARWWPIRVSAAIAGACRSSHPLRPAPGACAPIPIPSVRRSARPASWWKTMSPIASNSISPRRPKSFRATRRRSLASTDISSTARRLPISI